MAIVKNTGGEGLKNLRQFIETLHKKDVYVGVTRSSNKPTGDGINMATLLKIHEFGAKIPVTDKMRGYLAANGLFLKKTTQFITIPERAPLRGSMYQNSSKYTESLADLIQQAIKAKRTAEDVLSALGVQVSGDVKDYMVKGSFAPNHPFTVANKKSSKPLNDSGALRGSISYEVR